MIVIGLTGSIGMGKSFVAKQFKKLGAVVFDADKEVHRMLGEGGAAVAEVAKEFPSAKKSNHINRQILAEIVYKDKTALHKLESIVHRKVRQAEMDFIRLGFAQKRPLIVLDIPLLFETGFDRYCDVVVAVIAPKSLQRHRVVTKRGLAESKFMAINERQLSAREKAERADFVINTGLEKGRTVKEVAKIVAQILVCGKRVGARRRLMKAL